MPGKIVRKFMLNLSENEYQALKRLAEQVSVYAGRHVAVSELLRDVGAKLVLTMYGNAPEVLAERLGKRRYVRRKGAEE